MKSRIKIIAGPCSAESREQVLDTAKALAKTGIYAFRAGLWKPRTRPGMFEGVGSKGLQWLSDVKKETGLKVCCEVATPEHLHQALEAGVDILWIGARTTADPCGPGSGRRRQKSGQDSGGSSDQESCQSRCRALGWCPGAFPECRNQADNPRSPRLQLLRQPDLPQHSSVAHPDRDEKKVPGHPDALRP